MNNGLPLQCFVYSEPSDATAPLVNKASSADENVKPLIFSSLTQQNTVRPRKKETINQVNFSENYNDLSEEVYIVTKFSLSSFF